MPPISSGPSRSHEAPSQRRISPLASEETIAFDSIRVESPFARTDSPMPSSCGAIGPSSDHSPPGSRTKRASPATASTVAPSTRVVHARIGGDASAPSVSGNHPPPSGSLWKTPWSVAATRTGPSSTSSIQTRPRTAATGSLVETVRQLSPLRFSQPRPGSRTTLRSPSIGPHFFAPSVDRNTVPKLVPT